MKKPTLILFYFLLFSSTAFSQITVTNSTFPQIGDTLKTAINNFPNGIDVGDAGANQTWDFTSLEAPFVREDIIRAPEEGLSAQDFPNASILSDLPVGNESIADAYYLVDENRVELLGYFGADPIGIGLELLVKFRPSLTDRRAPMNYGDKHIDEGAALLAVSENDLPQEVLDSLPIKFDSLRLRLAIDRQDEVDAWGEMTIPALGITETYEVLREKRIEIRELRLDIKISFLPWQDITELLEGEFPFLGKDTTTSYRFFSNEEKEPIAVVTMNQDGTAADNVVFKADDITNKASNISLKKPNIFAYPNPTANDLRFEFINLEPGNYRLKVFNILGVQVWENTYQLGDGTNTFREDFSRLRKGTYLYTLFNEKGKAIATKRLMIMRP